MQRDFLRGPGLLLLLQGLDAASSSSTRGQKCGPQQVTMVMQFVADYKGQILKTPKPRDRHRSNKTVAVAGRYRRMQETAAAQIQIQ